jgi:hypothetical protein
MVKSTPAFALAAESPGFACRRLVVAGKTARLAPGVDRNTVFVADWSGEVQQISDNRLGAGLERYEIR